MVKNDIFDDIQMTFLLLSLQILFIILSLGTVKKLINLLKK